MSTEKKPKPSLGKVLVVGGAGMLGHNIVELLLEMWTADISVLDIVKPRMKCAGVAYHEGNITDLEATDALMGRIKPDVVIHTASPAPHKEGAVAHELFYKVNVEGTQNIVTACQNQGVKALVYTSSASILCDNATDLVNANERFPVIRGEFQTEYYSETKAAAEELVLKANRQPPERPLLTASIRPAGIFGINDATLTKHMVNLYFQGRCNVQVGDNDNLFDFTYAPNAAHAHLLAAQRLLATHASSTIPLDTERVDGEAFLVTNDTPTYFWDFCRAYWQAAGRNKGRDADWWLPTDLGLALGWINEEIFRIIGKTPTFNRQRILYSTIAKYHNIAKAKSRLGYRPLYSLQEGIQRSVDWYMDVLREEGKLPPIKA
jgi:sterol-4alpha-carboxylate 3-dehydrogenase (decarboxylating)